MFDIGLIFISTLLSIFAVICAAVRDSSNTPAGKAIALALTALLGIAVIMLNFWFGWNQYWEAAAEKEKEGVYRLRDVATEIGKVRGSVEWSGDKIVSLNFADSDYNDGMFKTLIQPAEDVSRIDLSGTAATGDTVESVIENFPNLEALSLSETAVQPQHIRELKRLKQLQHLHLANMREDINCKDLEVLKPLKLTMLDLKGAPIDDKCLEKLVSLFPGLEDLNISHTQIRKPGTFDSVLRDLDLKKLHCSGLDSALSTSMDELQSADRDLKVFKYGDSEKLTISFVDFVKKAMDASEKKGEYEKSFKSQYFPPEKVEVDWILKVEKVPEKNPEKKPFVIATWDRAEELRDTFHCQITVNDSSILSQLDAGDLMRVKGTLRDFNYPLKGIILRAILTEKMDAD